MKKLPPCHLCGNTKHVIPQGVSGEVFWCKRCSAIVDTMPEDRVYAPSNDPVRSAEMNERRKQGNRRT